MEIFIVWARGPGCTYLFSIDKIKLFINKLNFLKPKELSSLPYFPNLVFKVSESFSLVTVLFMEDRFTYSFYNLSRWVLSRHHLRSLVPPPGPPISLWIFFSPVRWWSSECPDGAKGQHGGHAEDMTIEFASQNRSVPRKVQSVSSGGTFWFLL